MTRTRILLIGVGLALCGACSLNPQPFPPAPENNGDQTGATSDGGRGADAFTPSPDAGSLDDSGYDSGTMSNDAGLDAPIDSPKDAPIDAPERDGDSDASLVNDN